VHRVALVGFGERQLELLITEAIGAALKPIGPRDQSLSSGGAADLVSLIAIQDRSLAELIGAQAAADLDPLSLVVILNQGWVQFHARQFETTVEHCRRALELATRIADKMESVL